MSVANSVAEHYSRNGLSERLQEALRASGLGDKRLAVADLAPLDQFHTRGLAATMELAEAAWLEQGMKVLDLGSGLGGPSRYLAATFGCRVVGVDLSPAFVAAARFLAERSGLADLVEYDLADAQELPYEDQSFDLVWTQHVAMNIADRQRLYGEVRRVLKPGGRLAIYDVVAGQQGPLHFPVPWASGPATSFLLSASAMRDVLEGAGFRVLGWSDCTAVGAAWFAEQAKARQAAGQPPTLGLHVAMGPEFPVMAANLGRNLLEGRVGLVQAVLDVPPG